MVLPDIKPSCPSSRKSEMLFNVTLGILWSFSGDITWNQKLQGYILQSLEISFHAYHKPFSRSQYNPNSPTRHAYTHNYHLLVYQLGLLHERSCRGLVWSGSRSTIKKTQNNTNLHTSMFNDMNISADKCYLQSFSLLLAV